MIYLLFTKFLPCPIIAVEDIEKCHKIEMKTCAKQTHNYLKHDAKMKPKKKPK